MKIEEYKDEYIEGVRDLLVQLEEYLVSVDRDSLDTVGPEYREKMVLYDIAEVRENRGAAFVALSSGNVIGFISGVIRCYSEADHLDYKCPKAGVIKELVVDSAFRGRGTGKALIEKMEQYFREIGCEAISVDVFAYNEKAHRFYEKAGYHPRMITMIKTQKAVGHG